MQNSPKGEGIVAGFGLISPSPLSDSDAKPAAFSDLGTVVKAGILDSSEGVEI